MPVDPKVYKKIFKSVDDLCVALEPHRDKKIVFTGGVFDLFHYGHLNYLERSKALGEILIVQVDSDDLIASRKGYDRPVIGDDMKKAMIISALATVDFVLIVGLKDSENDLLSKMHPNVYVRVVRPEQSEDYRSTRIASLKEKFPHVETVYINPTEGISTTYLVNKIKAPYLVMEDLDPIERKLIFKSKRLIKQLSLSEESLSHIAAILTLKGHIYLGVSLLETFESSLPCAERVAIANAVIQGEREIETVVLYTPSKAHVSPCGLCRQVILEFSAKDYPTKIVLVNGDGEILMTDIHKLLPMPFQSVRKKDNA